MESRSSHLPAERQFSVGRSLKLGTFHIGSSLGDLLTSAVWNRVLIVDLGVPAWPVALLSALRYLFAPLTLWAGHRSDTRPILGSRRIAYIWLGRLLMLLALPLLPLSTREIAWRNASPIGWMLALLSSLLYGAGTLISGPPFLALAHDSAPYERRGQVISIVQTMLVVSFAFVPVLYAALMPSYEQGLFVRLVLVGMVGAAIFWVFSVFGQERLGTKPVTGSEAPSVRVTFGGMWSDVNIRRYAVFLTTSAFFAFMQDAVLEPFGGDVFGLAAGETTRFNAYWGVGVLMGMVGTVLVTRRWRPEQQVSTTSWGLALGGLLFLLLGVGSLQETSALVAPMLVALGIGFGVFTVGGVSLLMAMCTDELAGSYLALWSVLQLCARGGGIAMGGVIRDAALTLSGRYNIAYAVVFALEAVGLFATILLLRRVDVRGFVTRRVALRPSQALTTESA